ncbi:CaiB/BaiF CoA transferase family protein [Novosphingobium tardum]|uniref:CaiB/BaiF CoA transferase family protein n=1 Tax=Novosphingobium tardum TaxID=1538021 RepID=A0ABV8RRB1_9SPHN
MLPLSGIKVIDLGSVLMAPYASQWLGDLGADVVKVETRDGDSTRHTGPSTELGMAAMFLGANRNKRSIVLDLRNPEGLETLLRLVEGADIFLHNIRPQKVKKLGIDPETVAARNPRVVYAGLYGFGEGGPYSGRPAYDDIIQGMCGNSDLMMRQTGMPGYFPTVSADKTSGLVAAIAILAALSARERSGRGGVVEIPMFETMAAFNLVEHLYGGHFEPPLGRPGYPRVLARTRAPFPTLDGFISVMPYTDRHWTDLFEEVGSLSMREDIRFADIAARTRNIGLLYEKLAEIIATRSTSDWVDVLGRLDIPSAPVIGLDELVHDQHLEQTDFFSELSDESMGHMRFPGVPVRFDGVRPGISMPPRLGEHTIEVLVAAGLSSADIEQLLSAGAAFQHSFDQVDQVSARYEEFGGAIV